MTPPAHARDTALFLEYCSCIPCHRQIGAGFHQHYINVESTEFYLILVPIDTLEQRTTSTLSRHRYGHSLLHPIQYGRLYQQTLNSQSMVEVSNLSTCRSARGDNGVRCWNKDRSTAPVGYLHVQGIVFTVAINFVAGWSECTEMGEKVHSCTAIQMWWWC